jgi:hypothetical protein
VASARAGEEGEYHHSRNLIKKMAVGRATFKESRRRRGVDKMARRRIANKPAGGRLARGFDLGDGACEWY